MNGDHRCAATVYPRVAIPLDRAPIAAPVPLDESRAKAASESKRISGEFRRGFGCQRARGTQSEALGAGVATRGPSEAVTRCAHYITQHKFQPLCPTQYEKPKSGSSPGPTASDEGGVTSLTQQSHKHQSAGKRAIARETSLATPSPHMHMLGPAAFSGTARRRLR